MSARDRWHAANLGLACLAIDPGGIGGLWLRARVGPVRDRVEDWINAAFGDGLRTSHPSISDEALFGGMDLSATLDAGRLVQTRGLLATARLLRIPMAERLPVDIAGRLAQAMDMRGDLAILALDEGCTGEETLSPLVQERLGLHLDLGDIGMEDAPSLGLDLNALADARRLLPRVHVADGLIAGLCEVALSLGVMSLRAPLQALALARASAALGGADNVEAQDLTLAVELVLAPRATRLPAPPEMEDAHPTPPEPAPDTSADTDTGEQNNPNAEELPTEMLLEAARAVLPPDLFARIAAGKAKRAATGQGAGAKRVGNRRGRPLPARAGRLSGGARLDLIATLRNAAPWQTIRRQATGIHDRVHVRRSDLCIKRFQDASDRAIIFVVDASGSAAMARLAEAKGAVELLLAEAYARRDHVALVAFRGTGSELLLPPTRSLVQTKRRLSTLPGGGGTPLAAGLKAGLDLAQLVRGKGMTPAIALLTDGRANVDLEGTANRTQAGEDAGKIAQLIRGMAISGLVIDTGQRPSSSLSGLATTMGVAYLPLPRADSQGLSRAVDTALIP